MIAAFLCPLGVPAKAQEAIFVPERPVNMTPALEDDPLAPLLAVPVAPPKMYGQSLPVHASSDQEMLADGTRNADPMMPVQRSEDDLVLVAVQADGATLADNVPGYVSKQALVLPLGQITEALEFPIKISVKEGIADGWFYRDDNRFALDVARHEATVGGIKQDYDPRLVELHDDDIFVDRELLEKWFSLKIDFVFSSQTVKVAATGANRLPIEISGELEKRKQALSARFQPEAKNFPASRAPYTLYSVPFTNVSLTGGYDNSSGDRPFSGQMSLESTGDFLYMNSDFFSTYSDSGDMGNWRLSLSRRDPEGELFADDELIRHTWVGEAFHELKVRDLTLGDVFTPEIPLTAKNKTGTGFYVTNQPFDRVTQFDRTTLEGNIQPNWDVELYRNDELLAFQKAGADGRYVFYDVPLVSGLNIMRFVFHGPFAETREETRRIMVSADMTKAGQSYFRMGMIEQGRVLSDMVPSPTGSGVGTDTGSSLNAERGGLRSFFDYEYGLFNNLSLYGQLVHMPTDSGTNQSYATAGLGTSLLGVYGRVDASASSEGGQAVQGLAQTNIWGVTLTARHQMFSDFISDFTTGGSSAFGNTDPIVRYSEFRVDTPLNVAWLPRLNLGFSGDQTVYKSGLTLNEASQRISSSLGRLAVSNSLSYQRYTGGDDTARSSETQTVGDLTLSLPVLGVNLRGGASYEVLPRLKLDNIAFTADKSLSQNLNLRGEISQDMTDSKLTTYLVGINRTFEKFQLGFNGTYDSENRLAAFVNLTFSFGREPVNDSWHFFSDQTAREGIVTARAYRDKNNNGVFDQGDEGVPDIAIRSDGGGMAMTDESGVAMLVGQRTTARNNVTVDDASLPNPSWVVTNEGYGVIARPGTPVHVDFAIAECGVVDGTVYLLKDDGSKTVASNVVMQLVNGGGKVAAENRSSFDGYYIFERIRPGHYHLRVSPEQMTRRNLKSSDPVAIDIKGEESALSGVDFVLSRL